MIAVEADPRRGLVVSGLLSAPFAVGVAAAWTELDRPAQWASAGGPAADGDGWVWEQPAFRLGLSAEARAGGVALSGWLEARRPLLLDRVSPAVLGADVPVLRALPEARYYQSGYGSWAAAGSVAADSAPVYPLSRSFAVSNHFVDSPWYGRRDGLISSWLGVLARGDDGFLAGFLTAREAVGELFLAPGSWEAALDFGGRAVAPGERVALEPLLLARGRPEALLDGLAAEAAEAAGISSIKAPVVGWCSWYHFYTGVTAADLGRNAAALAAQPQLGASLVQLDDGYQTAVGDWRSFNRKFPGGVAPVAAAIRENGFEAGIWTAPFFASRGARVLRDHPDWRLRDGAGRGVDCGFNPGWRARQHALDLSHPGVLDHLRQTFAALRDDGFTFFKCDFLYAGLRRGRRARPERSPTACYRDGLAAVRDGIGPDAFLLGCGAPLAPSVGLVDAMRVSGDVKEEWFPRIFGLFGAGCGVASLRESARNNATRAWMHGRLWQSDPDCLLVRDTDTKLDEDETRLLVTVAAQTGGVTLVSDDLPRVPAGRMATLERVLPPAATASRVPGLMAETRPGALLREGAGRRLVTLINWEDRAARRPIPLEDEVDVWIYDFWMNTVITGEAVEVPRHGVRALLLTPRADRPQVVGTDLHLLGLVEGRIAEELEDDRLRIAGRDLARREGELWVALPAGWTVGAVTGPVAGVRPWAGGVVVAVRGTAPWVVGVERSI